MRWRTTSPIANRAFREAAIEREDSGRLAVEVPVPPSCEAKQRAHPTPDPSARGLALASPRPHPLLAAVSTRGLGRKRRASGARSEPQASGVRMEVTTSPEATEDRVNHEPHRSPALEWA